MPPKVRLAFIGCGGVVAGHLDAGLKDFPDVEFVGWCDVNEGAANESMEIGKPVKARSVDPTSFGG